MTTDVATPDVVSPRLPEFPVGWYDTITATRTPEKVSREGVNILLPYIINTNYERISNYLDAAEKAGVKVVLDIYRSIVQNEDTDAAIEFIRTFKEHPALFGWYLYDEPEIHGVSAKKLKTIYETIKTEDPIHPVVLATTQPARVSGDYKEVLDIVLYPLYPILYNSEEFTNLNNLNFKSILERYAPLAINNGKEFWFVLQGMGKQPQREESSKNWRLPTKAEERYMLYTARLAGSQGFLFFSHYRSNQSWINSVLTPIIQEFNNYIGAIHSTLVVKKAPTDRDDVEVGVYQSRQTGNYVLVGIHHALGNVDVNITMKELASMALVRVWGENRSFIALGGSFKDNFGDYAVHIYEIRTLTNSR
ncbi:hypothetical protein [Oscillatoria sp. HE19RPO]|uniref:hypothetical protein n=1 Tax=Oscillatoria sp. HE19RPO TaxID=2954806 RepID=UPI0020C3B818|nr:hypothetical protein [Oscillatoria sp. HE19RPO]